MFWSRSRKFIAITLLLLVTQFIAGAAGTVDDGRICEFAPVGRVKRSRC